jgi:hypothetical protein
MNPHTRIAAEIAAAVAAAALIPAVVRAGDPIDDIADAVRDATRFETEDRTISFDLDLYLTMDNFVMSQPPPGIIDNPNDYLANPRLSMLGQVDLYDWITMFALGGRTSTTSSSTRSRGCSASRRASSGRATASGHAATSSGTTR